MAKKGKGTSGTRTRNQRKKDSKKKDTKKEEPLGPINMHLDFDLSSDFRLTTLAFFFPRSEFFAF